MKTKINLLLFLTFSIFTFAQGFGSSKTTQSLNFPTSDNVAEGKARIYIMRTTGTLWNYSVTVYLDEKVIGKVGPKAYLMFEVDEGKPVSIGTAFIGNRVRIKSEENQEFLTVNPKAGKTYYIGVKAKYGTFRGQTEMTPLEPEKALKLIPEFEKPKVNFIE